MTTRDQIAGQVRASELEAGFSLVCTLAVCVFQEWGRWHHVGAAVAIPIAMAFSVHGVNNATGLGPWNWVYIPTRIAVIVLGVAYSYQHYYHFLPELEVAGIDLKPGVAFIMELLTLSALIAHQGHSTRLHACSTGDGELSSIIDPDPELLPPESLVPDESDRSTAAAGDPHDRPLPGSVSLFAPQLQTTASVGASSPSANPAGGSHKPQANKLNGVPADAQRSR